jgi:superfamily II RNA helicase
MHHSNKKRPYKGSGRKRKRYIIKMKPGADSKVSKIFEQIGVPEATTFTPDKFQIDAVSAVKHSDCLVMAPTGSGKTWIAEESIRHALSLGHKIWYGTPLKALTNTIYANFKEKFGADKVGILTGDRKENRNASVVIGTTEILRNQLYDSMHKGTDLKTDFVILDEAHFLGDKDRGVVWEEIMIYLPSRIPLLMLSATIGNGKQIASWLYSIRGKECVIINEEKRPVPLYPLFLHPSGTLYPLLTKSSKDKTVIHKKVVDFITKKDSSQFIHTGGMPPIGEIMKVLDSFDLLPAIFFLKSRADCDRAVELCTAEILAKDPERRDKLTKRVIELVEKSPHMSKHKQLWILENLAVGSHHSGQLPIWKIIIETLMSEGLLSAIFATSTVAAGVNFPARTVVIFNSDRFNGIEFAPLDASQIRQMTGRAGRRGMDNVGFAINIPGKFMDLKSVAKLINAPSSNVDSQININFSMVLNLLLSHDPKQIKKLLENSFAAFQLASDKKKKKYGFKEDDDREFLWNDFLYHLEFLQIEGYVDHEGNLTDEGKWASNLRIDSPLLVAEALKMDLFPKNDPALLAAIIASFVNERDFDDDKIDKKQTQKKLLTTFIRIKSQLKPFATEMFRRGFEVKPLYLKPAITIYSWAATSNWEKTVKQSGLAEGDLARLIMRTAENLRHFKSLREIFPEIADSALESVDLLMKEPVVSYYE